MTTPQDTELKIYEVTNRETGKCYFAVSDNAQDACKQAGWLVGDCFVREAKQQRKPRADDHSALLVKIPCQVCSYQYGECKKPDTDKCPTQPTAPELREWLKQAAQAHACPYIGQDLTKRDHQRHQKWLPLSQAIDELTPKP